ncbi:MAG: EAL domain-containing protein [Trueperaceae bacterium]|nr:EAL domain-containing protein [Trueperaceae bacterium]
MAEPSRAPTKLDQLGFQYQPVVPLQQGLAGWHEALLRWHLPDGTIRGPQQVLPYWLGPHRQPTFTRFTVDQAARLLQGDPQARLSINLSPRQVVHPAAMAALADLLPTVRGRLIVEVTEQRYRDVAGLWTTLASLARNCELVLLDDLTVDDLGPSARARAPVDGIKLDRSVLAALVDPATRAATAAALRGVADRYAIVVAEGVEDVRHLQLLDGLGITHAQGYGIGRPAPRPVAPTWPADAPLRPVTGAVRAPAARYRRG